MADAAARYWPKIDQSGGPAVCWPWTAARNYKGYGLFYNGVKVEVATRWGWRHLRGEIPEKHQVCHSCDNPSCMNPEHWFLGTAADNHADRNRKGRQASGDRNGMRLHPDRVARGNENGSRRHPERLSRGDEHYSRTAPELLVRGESHGQAKLTEASVVQIRARHAAGERLAHLAREFGVAPVTISRIASRRNWKHVP